MRSFRSAVRRSRWLVVLVLLCNFSYSVEAYTYVSAYQRHHQEEKQLREVAERLGVPVEKLRREQPGLIDSLRNLFLDKEAETRRMGQAQVEAQLKKMAEQVAANPYRSQIDEVKNAYQSHRLDGLLRDLTQLSTTDVVSLPVASRKALLKNVRKALEEDLEPYVPDSLPPKARGRHNQLKGRLHALYGKLRKILDDPDALSDPKLAQTLGKIATEVNGEVHRPQRGPRFADRPLPLQLREQTVRTEEVTQPVGAPSSAVVTGSASSRTPLRIGAATSPEIAALAQSLGNSPARIFAHVHDNVRFDPKWGAVRSPLGTLQEGEGTSWDQAWLLLELLTAAGVEAKVEWGQVEISASLLLTLTGTSDPFDAGNLISTGGVPAVLLVQGGQVVGARLSHVWVKAHIDYIPNRGVTSGTPDAWVRMDPSFKRYGSTAGIDVHSHVPFDLGNYLQSGTELSPRRSYEDALWAYIRANNIDCVNLEQLKKAAQVVRERFPYIPGTLRGKVLRIDGEQAAVPESFQQRLTLEVKTAAGSSLVTWSTPAPAVYGKRVEIDYVGASPDDQATLAAYGGVFETPPYLVDLKPVVRVAGATVAQGSDVGSARDTEVWVTMTAPTGPPTIVTHVTSAGERHVLAADLGEIPQPVLDTHLTALNAARTAGNASEEEAETLYLIGAQYLHNLGRDLTDLSGWRWQRLVRLGTEGLISQTGVVTTTVGGAPISFRRGQRNVDIALMPLGMVPADGRRQFRREAFELLGAQSSFLEGEVFHQVLQRKGIASVSALTRSKREGQALTRVDGANVNAVLAQADLGADAEAEIREGVTRGRIAWVAESRIAVQQWTGTGYVIEDPATGAAAYLISGGFAGGDETGEPLEELQDLLGSEPWLESSPLGELLRMLLGLFGGGGGGDGEGGPGTNQSDPINLSTGNMWFTEIDLKVQARGLPIVFARTYNSRSTRPGPLGFGWSFNYGERLDEQGDGSVLYLEADGSEHLFAIGGTGGYVPPPGKHLELSKDASGFRLRTKDGLISTFALDGRLLTFSEPNGNTVTLGYDPAGNLATVTDAAARQVLTVTSSDGKITQLTDLTDRTVVFSYTGEDLTGARDTVGQLWSYSYDADHNLIAKSNPLGGIDRYAYDVHDRCYRHVDPLEHVEIFSYTYRGRRAAMTDRRGYDSYFELDERGRATLQVDPLGNAAGSTWSEGNDRLTTTDPRGGLTTRTFDAEGNLLSETNPKQETTSYTYEPVFNQVKTTTDPAGHVVTNTYDTRGNLLESSQVVGNQTITSSSTYDGFGRLTSQTDANGETSTLSWDDTKGVLVSQTDALQHATTMETDALGRIVAVIDPAETRMEVTWDDRDRITAAQSSFGNVIAIRYDEAGRQTEMTTPRGATRTDYDAAGRPVAITDVLGNTIRTEYDEAGNAVLRIDARGSRTTTTYDPLGRVMTMVDPLGQLWSYGYCAEISGSGGGCCGSGGGGNPGIGSYCELTDPQGHTTKQEFDVLGRVTRVTDPLGNVSQIGYDERGRKTSVTDALERTTRYEYDDLERLTAVVDANQARTEYTYDRNGNLVALQDAEERVWQRTYDELNRLATEKDPLGHTTSYRYDLLGNLEKKINPDGREIGYVYDVKRLRKVLLPGGGEESFAYDGLGRRTSMVNAEVSIETTFDALSRVTQTTNHTLGKSVGYQHDRVGNLVRMTTPEAIVDFMYDASNRLVEQRDSTVGTFRYEYDPVGRRSKLHYPNGLVTEYAYDGAGRLESILTRAAQGQVVDGYSYTYDAVGNRTSMRSLRDGLIHEYQYDAVGRLTSWERGEGSAPPERFERYDYDDVGNRVTLTDESGTVSYAYDSANRLLEEVRRLSSGASATTTYGWDDNGNMTNRIADGGAATTYSWDPLGRMVAVAGPGGTHSYGYDPNGQRFRQTENGQARFYLLAREDIACVYAGGQLAEYVSHAPGIDEPLAAVSDNGTRYLHRDGTGSITAASGVDSQLAGTGSFTPFGDKEQGASPGGNYDFTGRERDATGLLYYRARYYDSSLGRFTSQDPVTAPLHLPQLANNYAYAANNPITQTDAFGTFPSVSGILGFIYRLIFKPCDFLPIDWKLSCEVFKGSLIIFVAGIARTYENNLLAAALSWIAYAISLISIIDIMVEAEWYAERALSRLDSVALRDEVRPYLLAVIYGWVVFSLLLLFARIAIGGPWGSILNLYMQVSVVFSFSLAVPGALVGMIKATAGTIEEMDRLRRQGADI